MKETFLYFAYGSNMLTTRLSARCPSAKPLGVYMAQDWRVDFIKRSGDGSGKASLAPSPGDAASGVLFEIAQQELDSLNKAEGSGYHRRDDFVVRNTAGETIACATYIANAPADGLKPYNWYLALIVAGASEHQLEEEYRRALSAALHKPDERPNCQHREAALEALLAAGYRDVAHALSAQA